MFDGLERDLSILDRSLLKSPDYDARSTHRQASVVLTSGERQTLRDQVRAAAACGSRWMAFRGWKPGDEFDTELRLVCQARCGTRRCAECMERIRARECHRVAGPWKLFFTFTMPRQVASAAKAWRSVHAWISKLTRVIRKEARIALIEDEENAALSKPFSGTRRLNARSRIRLTEKLEYAWVLEPHADGWPHIHIVVSADFASFEWLRRQWCRVLRTPRAWIYGEKVYQINGVCHYLTKYISKAKLTPDILAICYNRRLWASTIERPEKPEPRWFREDSCTSDRAQDSANAGDGWAPELGWELVESKAGGYALWKRERASGYDWTTPEGLREASALERESLKMSTDAIHWDWLSG